MNAPTAATRRARRDKKGTALQFDKTIKAGDILTSVTVAISAIGLVSSLAKDRAVQMAEHAGKIRLAAASAIVKLDRWEAVQLSLYQQLQPTFVETSEQLASKFDLAAARDSFWRQVNQRRTEAARQVLDEQLGTPYLEILAYVPSARLKYVDAFTRLSEMERTLSDDFMREAEQAIFSFRGRQAGYQTAFLGNELRKLAATSSLELRARSEATIEPVRKYLLSIIETDDEQIVKIGRATPTK